MPSRSYSAVMREDSGSVVEMTTATHDVTTAEERDGVPMLGPSRPPRCRFATSIFTLLCASSAAAATFVGHWLSGWTEPGLGAATDEPRLQCPGLGGLRGTLGTDGASHAYLGIPVRRSPP